MWGLHCPTNCGARASTPCPGDLTASLLPAILRTAARCCSVCPEERLRCVTSQNGSCVAEEGDDGRFGGDVGGRPPRIVAWLVKRRTAPAGSREQERLAGIPWSSWNASHVAKGGIRQLGAGIWWRCGLGDPPQKLDNCVRSELCDAPHLEEQEKKLHP